VRHDCGAVSQLIDVVRRYDLRSAKAHLVTSVPGEAQNNGQLALRAALASSCIDGQPTLVYATPFIGSLSPAFITSFIESCRGAAQPAPVSKKKRARGDGYDAAAAAATPPALGPPLLIAWPSARRVRDSYNGWHAGVTFRTRGDEISNARVSRLAALGPDAMPPRHVLLCEAEWPVSMAACDRSLVSAPMCMALAGDSEVNWLLTGSHALAPGAWGKLSVGGGITSVTSFEMSVLLTPTVYAVGCAAEAALLASGALTPSRFTVLAGAPPLPPRASFSPAELPIPFDLPLRPYPAPSTVPGVADESAAGPAASGLVEQPEPYVKSGGAGVFLSLDAHVGADGQPAPRTNPLTWPKHVPGATKGGGSIR